ncbi:hypothetical protein GCM10007426_29230 [Alloalcanivorax dieselolei]|uniref:hypothetical protein n=1 Tax=Alloalcanivorax dieselolei TaxID=285091 RepID=UPI0011D23E03|nr:hypothetical protein [Alloalcanivorax dieselolei]GGJ98277.1 hypothetical protein GCM10007426_29230 [Alloalcanivorax dieselolei]
MNSKTFKPMMLALAGAVALAGTGSAHADDPEWALYNGTSTLTNSDVGSITCYLTIGGTITNDGDINVKSVGVKPGDPNCTLLRIGNENWTGTLAGGTLATGTDSTVVYAGGSVITTCGGLVTGITYGPTASGTINTPSSVNVSGAYGTNCSITADLTLVADDR